MKCPKCGGPVVVIGSTEGDVAYVWDENDRLVLLDYEPEYVSVHTLLCQRKCGWRNKDDRVAESLNEHPNVPEWPEAKAMEEARHDPSLYED
jgi:hypothetical protein